MQKMLKKKISIILPTYNEKENIIPLIKSIPKYCGKSLYEIIVVDDDSPDGTWKIISRLKKKIKHLRLIRRVGERGLPSAISKGIENAKGNFVLWMDCDFSHPMALIPKMIEHIPDYDVVSASRFVKGGKDKRSFLRVIASRALNIFGDLVLGLEVKDITSGFYLVKKSLFDKIKLKKEGYAEYCIRFTNDAIKNGYRWKEIPYIFIERKSGSSKSYVTILNFIKNGYLCIREIIRLRFAR